MNSTIRRGLAARSIKQGSVSRAFVKTAQHTKTISPFSFVFKLARIEYLRASEYLVGNIEFSERGDLHIISKKHGQSVNFIEFDYKQKKDPQHSKIESTLIYKRTDNPLTPSNILT